MLCLTVSVHLEEVFVELGRQTFGRGQSRKGVHREDAEDAEKGSKA
jgi:hypothetical protein